MRGRGQTLELFYVLRRIGYEGAIYFDTFPDTTGLDSIAECEANITTVVALRAVAAKLQGDPDLARAIGDQDAVAGLAIVRRALYGV